MRQVECHYRGCYCTVNCKLDILNGKVLALITVDLSVTMQHTMTHQLGYGGHMMCGRFCSSQNVDKSDKKKLTKKNSDKDDLLQPTMQMLFLLPATYHSASD